MFTLIMYNHLGSLTKILGFYKLCNRKKEKSGQFTSILKL